MLLCIIVVCAALLFKNNLFLDKRLLVDINYLRLQTLQEYLFP